MAQESLDLREPSAVQNDAGRFPLATVFSIPKPFVGHVGLIQTNAIKSWTLLGPEIEIILIGDEAGTAEAAQAHGCRHIPGVDRNEFGTPLLNHAFQLAHKAARGPFLAYVNADIMLFEDFPGVLRRLRESEFERFLLIGRRTDVDIREPIDFEDNEWRRNLRARLERNGSLAPAVCKDYFVYPKSLFAEIPAFTVGRGNWDNWMIATALKDNIPVIDATRAMTVLHQNHDHAHLAGGRYAAYFSGPEAERNRAAAGGRNIMVGAARTVIMSADGRFEKGSSVPVLPFFLDLPRFFRLAFELLFRRS